MERKKYTIRIICFWLIGLAIVAIASPWQNAQAKLTAKTTLTVVDAPGCVATNFTNNHNLWNVNYVPGWVSWEWEKKDFPQGSTILSGLIWKISSTDGGRTYDAFSWDYITNSSTGKHRESNSYPSGWFGTMLSSLCHINDACGSRRKDERTNIQFWQYGN